LPWECHPSRFHGIPSTANLLPTTATTATKRKKETMTDTNREICEQYLQGNSEAIRLIDTLIAVSADLSFIRSNEVDWDETEMGDYNDFRAELDMAIDNLEPILIKYNLMPTDLPLMK